MRKLVGFAQAALDPDASEELELSIPARELAYYEVGTGWVIEPGTYTIEVGPNVATLPLSVSVTR